MEIVQNDAPGESVILVAGDDLANVPKSHKELITPLIREVFLDPPAHFRRMAQECPFATMKKWLEVVLEEGDWALALHRGSVPTWTSVVFNWYSSEVNGAGITPASEPPPNSLPAALRSFYSQIDEMNWAEFGYAGGLYNARTQRELPVYSANNPERQAAPATVHAFGGSLCGDELVYTSDGRAGWRSHETGAVHFLGTIEDTINWVFGELCEGRCPDWLSEW